MSLSPQCGSRSNAAVPNDATWWTFLSGHPWLIDSAPLLFLQALHNNMGHFDKTPLGIIQLTGWLFSQADFPWQENWSWFVQVVDFPLQMPLVGIIVTYIHTQDKQKHLYWSIQRKMLLWVAEDRWVQLPNLFASAEICGDKNAWTYIFWILS